MADDLTPDFSSSVPMVDNAIATVDAPDFSNSQPETEAVIYQAPPKNLFGKIGDGVNKLLQNMNITESPELRRAKSMNSYAIAKANNLDPVEVEKNYEKYALNPKFTGMMPEATAEDVMNASMTPMMAAAVVLDPVVAIPAIALTMGVHTAGDMLGLGKAIDESALTPEAKSAVRIMRLFAEGVPSGMAGGRIGGALKEKFPMLQDYQRGVNDFVGLSGNMNIEPNMVKKLQDTNELLPEEKIDIAATLGISEKHIEASLASGMPINVTVESMLKLAEKPYWERARTELLGTNLAAADALDFKNTESALKFGKENEGNMLVLSQLKTIYDVNNLKIKDMQTQSDAAIKAGDMKLSDQLDSEGFVLAQKNQLYREALEGAGSSKDFYLPKVNDLMALIAQKDLSINTMSRLKKFLNIENLKKATPGDVAKVTKMVDDLKPEDKFLSDKQLTALDEIIGKLESPEVTPKRVVADKFGEKDEILSKGILSKVTPELMPAVDIKQGHPLITKIVNDARDLFTHAEKEISRRNENFDKMLTAAEKSRVKMLTPEEKLKRGLTPQNVEIFKALGGEKIHLTKEEAAVVAYMRNFFAKAKDDLKLEKYRTNYVTHMEKSLTEKILTKGLLPAIQDVLAGERNSDIPTNIMLELENIIGSEKFFKYALERKGGMDPTTNLRQILNTYSNLYETKMALDKVLPEGQAITQELLKGKSAVWMKKFLQNLKGRGMDFQFKNGPMAWLAKTADAIVDIGYIKMLGFNYMSAIKNVVAGETNSWLYSDFKSYLTGKQRFMSNPKRAYEIAKEYGILDGTYSDYAQKGIGSLKKLQDLSMIGQRIGEVEVRSSIMASMMTPAEWKSGKLSKERINEMKDIVAITQGVFSKVDSPLILQTWYGRMFFQMNRWRITNSLLMRRVVVDAATDIKDGNFKTQNVTRLGKMMVAYGVGMYIANELYKAGYKKAGDVAKNMANTVDGVASLFTEGDFVKMFTENPTLQSLKEISNTIREAAVYLHIPGAKSPQDKGVEDTYIAPVKTAEDILQGIENQ